MVRIQGRGVAGTVAAKVKHLFGLCKEFEEKVWKWRRFLTDVGCGRYKMRHLQTKVGHLHTKGHGERYVGSLFRVDEPVPDDSRNYIQSSEPPNMVCRCPTLVCKCRILYLQHPTSVKNRLHFRTFLPKSLHNPNKCLTFAATVPATPLP